MYRRYNNTGFSDSFILRFRAATARKHLNGDFILVMFPALVIAVVLWQTPLLFPFRVFTITMHETSHILAGLLTGSKVGQILISPVTASLAQVEPNGQLATIIVASAGYLGSTLFGGCLLILAKKPARQRPALFGIIGALFLILILFVRNPSGIFIFMVMILAGAVAFKAPNGIVTFSLYMLALLSCFNSMTDLLYLVHITNTPTAPDPLMGNLTDALILQNATNVPAIVWATVWSGVGGFMILAFVLASLFVRNPAAQNKTAARPNFGPQMSSNPYAYIITPIPPTPAKHEYKVEPIPTKPETPPTVPTDDEALIQSMLSRYES